MNRSLLGLLFVASASAAIPKFFLLGFTHILPDGLDHILFILGLFFLTRDFGAMFFQMTFFTLAHSLTLGLALYGILAVPTVAVEIVIALSIAYIGIENLFCNHLSRWRPGMVFIFGLVHGLGFAHSMQENMIDQDGFLPALFSYNLGIEFGQLAVIGITYLLVAAWWKRDWYGKIIARPASMTIAAFGFYWAVERIC
jgi:HupE / UreJ protein